MKLTVEKIDSSLSECIEALNEKMLTESSIGRWKIRCTSYLEFLDSQDRTPQRKTYVDAVNTVLDRLDNISASTEAPILLTNNSSRSSYLPEMTSQSFYSLNTAFRF